MQDNSSTAAVLRLIETPHNSTTTLTDDTDVSTSSSISQEDMICQECNSIDSNMKPAASKYIDASSKSQLSISFSIIRFLLMDVLLFSILIVFGTVDWFDYVKREYIMRQAEAFHWTNDRIQSEHTYYTRSCDAIDLSTNTTADLFVPSKPNELFNPLDAAEIQLKHGFTFIENVLSYQTMTELRDHINWKNHNDKQLFVIAKEHRFNILLGTEEKSVRNALVEIANHHQFRSSLEAMLGPNPALVELTAITSSAGAKEQYWHEDVNEISSATNYMQSFGPVYSVFIQLQNTTRAMGATSICPGSHYCTEGPLGAYCQAAGMQAVHPTKGYANGGDALIMNMNSQHRGAAHSDPNAPDRIMLILSFTPKPASRAERRQLSSGFTYQLRWDMWGHTLNDMSTAHTSMRQPWATLRSLGLYKPNRAEWGIDYIMQSTQRILHHDNGFGKDSLVEFIEEGGFPFIPSFLQSVESDSWSDYLLITLKKCVEFTRKTAIVAITSYLTLAILLFMISKPSQKMHRQLAARFALIVIAVATLNSAAKWLVDQSDWAKDLRANHRYTSTVPYDIKLMQLDKDNLPHFPQARNRTTFPNRRDVLIETRFGSSDLGIYNRFVNGHPGNMLLRELMAPYRLSYNHLSAEFQDAVAEDIVQIITSTEHRGRFLYQFPDGMWGRLTTIEGEQFVKSRLWLDSHPTVMNTMESIRRILTDFRYGIYRDTVLAQVHSPHFLKELERRILVTAGYNVTQELTVNKHNMVSSRNRKTYIRQNFLPTVRYSEHKRQQRILKVPDVKSREQAPEEWIEQGDIVEAFVDGYWYGGAVRRVMADGCFHFIFSDGDSQCIQSEMIRRIRRIKPQETMEIFMDNEYHECQVVEEKGDGLIVMKVETNEKFTVPSAELWRRKGGRIKVKADVFSVEYPVQHEFDVGDAVEVYFDDNLYYTGTITAIEVINEENTYTIEFIDGSTYPATDDEIREIAEYEIGELIDVYIDDAYQESEFIGKLPDGTYKVRIIEDDEIVEAITSLHIGRKK